MQVGYLSRLETPENIFVEESIVSNNKQKYYVEAINAYDQDVEIDIPPQEIQNFDLLDESEDFFDMDNDDSETPSDQARLSKIIDSLRLHHLNEEEKRHVIEIISDYPRLFHLPGDKLPATDVFQHVIHTTDEYQYLPNSTDICPYIRKKYLSK